MAWLSAIEAPASLELFLLYVQVLRILVLLLKLLLLKKNLCRT